MCRRFCVNDQEVAGLVDEVRQSSRCDASDAAVLAVEGVMNEELMR